MRSVAISVIAFILWLVLVMALTITLLKLHQDVETAQAEQVEALRMAEGSDLIDLSQLEERTRASHNLFNTAAIFLTGALAFGLVVFTIWVYRLAAAARDAQDLVKFHGLVSSAAETLRTGTEPVEAASSVVPTESQSAPSQSAPGPQVEEPRPDLLEREHAEAVAQPEPPTAAPDKEQPAETEQAPTVPGPGPAPIRASVTITPRGETIARPALDTVFDTLAPPDKERRHRFDLLRHAGLTFPELSGELRQLLELVSQPKTFMHQLVREISRHPVLAQKLIRFANTLYYSPPKPVRNLNFALVILGAEGVRSTALAQAVHDAYNFSDPLQVELWHHSIAVAIAAALIGRAVRHGKPDELYAQGLVHCLGRMVLLRNRPREYAGLADLTRGENVPARDVEREAFGFTNAEVGAVALAFWGLPRGFQGAVMYAQDLDAPGLSGFGRESAVAATVLNAAAAIAKKVIGIGAIPRDAEVDLAAHHAVRALGLGEARLDDVCQDLRDIYEEQRSFL